MEEVLKEETKKEVKVTPDIVLEWKNYFLSQNYALNSVECYYTFVKKFVGYGNEITQGKIDKFREENRSSVASASLKSFFRYLVSRKDYPENIMILDLGRSKTVKNLPKTLSPEEVEALIKSMPTLKDKIMTTLLYELALRISEALKLTWSDFDWFNWIRDKSKYSKVDIKNAKRKGRIQPVSPRIMDLLYSNHSQRTLEGLPIGNLLFPMGDDIMSYLGNKEQTVEMNKFQYIRNAEAVYRRTLNKASKEALNKHVNPHMLRHSKAQFMFDNGTQLSVIQEMLGHSSMTTTTVYAQASTKHVQEELERLDKKTNES